MHAFFPYRCFEPATPPHSSQSTCRETRKKKRMTPDTDKADTPSRHFPVRGTTCSVLAGIRATGFRTESGADRPTFPCKSTVVQMGDESLRGRLLTVAGAAHVGRSKRLRVSRLTAHQTDARAPKRENCKRDACFNAKYGRSKCTFFE